MSGCISNVMNSPKSVFEDEYDLAIAIQQGILARGKRGNYQVERFIFN